MTNEYVVHMLDSGFGGETWYTSTVKASSFPEAAVLATVEDHKRRGLNLDIIPHKVEFEERPNRDTIILDFATDVGKPYHRVVFYETEARRIYGGHSIPGHVWFSVRVREGTPNDCRLCGGTNVLRFKECHMKEKTDDT